MVIVHMLRKCKLGSWVILSGFIIAFCISCAAAGQGDTNYIIPKLDAELPVVVARGNSPSIQAAVVQGDQIVWSKAIGENTSVEHVYMNASVQKAFTAVAILQLVERGLIDLDADISEYIPFPVRHPEFVERPVTVRMLLAHRSGLGNFPHQFDWDTRAVFSPQYRPAVSDHLLSMSHEEFLMASLMPEGSNYDQGAWVHEPGQRYYYSVSAYPLLRYLVGQVSGQGFEDYMHENIFNPLGMVNSGFSAEEFSGQHTIPYTRIDDQNIKLPVWDGQGSMMHTTAEDMGKFIIALINDGQYDDFQLLQPETIGLMGKVTSRFKAISFSRDDLLNTGHGLGLFTFRGGWVGNGGSAPGYQCLFRFHPSRQIGYVILSNVNAILAGGKNYASARREVYDVQDAFISILDPTFMIRRWSNEILFVGLYVVSISAFLISVRRRKSKQRNDKIP